MNNLTSTERITSLPMAFGVFGNLLRLRRLKRFGKLSVFVLLTFSISYFVFIFPKHSQNDGGGASGRHQEARVRVHLDGDIEPRLNVRIWRSVCGPNLANLRRSPFFPRYPDEEKLMTTDLFQIEDGRADYGQQLFGYLHPAKSGSYRFAIASDDSSELWLSPSEFPEEKLMIAGVFTNESAAWTQKNQLDKYPEQRSNDVKLRGGKRYYIEVIHKQGSGDGFVQVFWKRSSGADFKVISSEYLSRYSNRSNNTQVTGKKESAHTVLSVQNHHEYKLKSNRTSNEYRKFYSLPLIPKDSYLPTCDYKTSFVSSDNIYRYEGQKLVSESNVFPDDDTSMGDPGFVWNRHNRFADKEVIHSVVNKMVTSLRQSASK